MLSDDAIMGMQHQWRRGVPMTQQQAGMLIAECQRRRRQSDALSQRIALALGFKPFGEEAQTIHHVLLEPEPE